MNDKPETAIVKPVQADIVPTTDLGRLMTVIEQGGRSAEEMTKVYDLMERMQVRQAQMQFNTALAAFQVECPQIVKTKKVDYVSKRAGTRVNYDFAPLEVIDRIVLPHLAKHGLSRRWGDAEEIGTGAIRIQFILSHSGGHSETNWSPPIPYDSKAAMSSQQERGNAVTYAKRYAMVAGCGLTTCDPDTDCIDPVETGKTIDGMKVNCLEQLMEEAKADRDLFFDWAGVERLIDLPLSRYDEAIRLLKTKKAKNK